jgi:hypothetical protein
MLLPLVPAKAGTQIILQSDRLTGYPLTRE